MTFSIASAIILFAATLFSSLLVYGTDGFHAALQLAFPLSSLNISVGGSVLVLLVNLIVISMVYGSLIMLLSAILKSNVAVMAIPVGIKRGNILGQYIAEVLLIAVFAFAASGITSNMFAATVADTLLQQTVQSNSLQDNAEDDTTMKSIDMGSMLEDEKAVSPDIQISVGIEDMLLLYLIGFCIIVISVTISSVSIMRLKPKNILNSMS